MFLLIQHKTELIDKIESRDWPWVLISQRCLLLLTFGFGIKTMPYPFIWTFFTVVFLPVSQFSTPNHQGI